MKLFSRCSLLVAVLSAGCSLTTAEVGRERSSASTSDNQTEREDAPDAPGAKPENKPAIPAAVPGSGSKRMVGYYASWAIYARNYQVADIPADRLTHLNFGFANLSPAGECVLGDPYGETEKVYPGDSTEPGALKGSFHQLQLLKQKHPQLKTLIAVGGWTWSAGFSAAASTQEGRSKLASSCVAFAKKYGFDGIDVDWEFPVAGGLQPGKPEDKQNFTLLLAELRKQLGNGLLTFAGPASPKVAANIELEKVGAIVDFVNLMAYDFHGPWEGGAAGHNAPLFGAAGDPLTVDAGVMTYLNGNVPADKVVLGMPLYGRGFGTTKGSWEPGIFDYKDLVTNYIPTMTRTWDPVGKVPTLFDAATNTTISYDDKESIAEKAKYARQKGLGGAMFWELSSEESSATLIDTVRTNL